MDYLVPIAKTLITST